MLARVDFPADLERAMRDAPDDRDLYRVAGDWLLEQGDPAGELIALATMDAPDGDALARLAQLRRQLDPDVRSRWRHWAVDWRWGFVRRAHIGAMSPTTVHQLLQSVLGRFVRELVLVGPTRELANHAALLRDHVALGSVTSLTIRATDRDEVLAPVPLPPRLERLVLQARVQGDLPLGTLRELTLHVDDPARLATDIPHLHTLVLELAPGTDAALSLLQPARYPALRRLLVIAPSSEPDARLRDRLLECPASGQLTSAELIAGDEPHGWTRPAFHRDVVLDRTRPEASAARLLVLAGPDAGTTIVPPDERAAFLRWDGLRWTAEYSLGSEPLRVNGRAVTAIELRDGDELERGTMAWRYFATSDRVLERETRTRLGLTSDP